MQCDVILWERIQALQDFKPLLVFLRLVCRILVAFQIRLEFVVFLMMFVVTVDDVPKDMNFLNGYAKVLQLLHKMKPNAKKNHLNGAIVASRACNNIQLVDID